jgi:ribose/xylose/arabinose/galactoside ABC-type transport system permease subunit
MTTIDGASGAPPSPAQATARLLNRIRRAAANSRFLGVLILLVVVFAFFSITQDGFLTSDNISSLLTGVSILFLVATGMTFVMLSSGIDLSMGSLLALSGVLLGKLAVDAELPIGVCIVLTLIAGAVLGGGVNGFLIGRVGLSFLVVTLGTLSLFQGVTNLWSDARTMQVVSPFLDSLAFDKLLGVPVAVWIMIVVAAIAQWVLRSTYFGRDVYAVGGNRDAARLSGINVGRTIMAVYAIAGLLAALGGVIQVARIGAASPLVGGTIVFDAAAAVLLGGTSFAGGIGGMTGTVVGVLFLGVLQNGLSVAGVQSFWQQVITGVILIAAVLIDQDKRQGWASVGLRRRPSGRGRPAGAG